ncbi:MAG: hypothetical protein LUC93_17015 [Planctomycetaceae bacterium]|nr:hypothetical protein [Planctomycetaceae bacterium]
MKKVLAAVAALFLSAGTVFAVEAAYCAPVNNYVDVVETVKVQVPVTTYVDEPYEYQATRMVPVQREVQVPTGRWVTETSTVPTTRTVFETQNYTAYETQYVSRPETRMRTVNRTVRENETRYVNRTVYDRVCDECGRSRRVARTETRAVVVPVNRRVCVQEPYTVNVREAVQVPVTRTRQVARSVPATREVTTRRWVNETSTRTVTTMQPVQETRTATRKRAVTTMQEQERQVVRRVPTDACGQPMM